MMRREIKTETSKNFFAVEYQYVEEAISRNICYSIDDYYNLMHLIKNSWTNKNYILKQRDAGYDIYSKNDEYLGVWIGVVEKSDYLFFFLYDIDNGILGKAIETDFEGPMVVYDFDDGTWIYNKIPLHEIFKEDNEEDQRKTLMRWINETIRKIL
jgi:hypothetical protein